MAARGGRDELPPMLTPAQLMTVFMATEPRIDFLKPPWFTGTRQHDKDVDYDELPDEKDLDELPQEKDQDELPQEKERDKLPHEKDYDELLQEMDDNEFFQQIRVTKKTHAFILSIVRKNYIPVYRGGNFPLDARLALDVTLTYLGSNSTYRVISELFGLSQTGVYSCVKKIVKVLCDVGGDFIKWPSAQEAPDLEKDFRGVAGFTGVIGALGGTHISIKTPNNLKTNYINSDKKHSVILMATCDNKKKFTYIDVGTPGSADDNSAFTSSSLYTGISEDAQAYFSSPSHHIIGDLAFTLSHHVMVPFIDTGGLTYDEVRYNTKLSKTRGVIERTYELLKARFMRLQYVDAEINRISNIITAACVLHNITCNFPEEEVTLLREGAIPIAEDIESIAEILYYSTASDKRNYLVLTL
ncbi:putative nuclease HARBI1 [Chionoecetes opilio]|uniref:Putative nuclease HARBI1 n=1 Tax=Chionoecetes opilio TaxID=41210 RepID=A0A8J4XMP1_CHIOP|nr:putative nuclease HARBI1 [Chionoecetes opilio]